MTNHHEQNRLTHVNEAGEAHMVDVGAKAETRRVATVTGTVTMLPETLSMIVSDTAKKGDVLATARIAGIMAAKKTADLVPLCHPIAIDSVEIDLVPVQGDPARIDISATVATTGKTGVEMEALTAATIAGVTIYDMCKAVDRFMTLDGFGLIAKSGGKSGTWTKEGVEND